METLFVTFLALMLSQAGVDSCKMLDEMQVNGEAVYRALCKEEDGSWGEYLYLERDGLLLVKQLETGEDA